MPKVPAPPSHAALLAAELDQTALLVMQHQVLHHIYPTTYAPDSFNPGLGSGRFHPILAADGKLVPIFYAADTEEGSYCETLFRAIGNGDNNNISPRRAPGKRVAAHSHAQLALATPAPLKLAHLSGNQLHRLGITRAALLEPGMPHYVQTAAWAAAIHAAYPALHGLAWLSRQHDTSTCMMFFGDRVASSQLTVLATQDLSSVAGRAQADAVGRRLSIVITR
jgi:hypothetical protein